MERSATSSPESVARQGCCSTLIPIEAYATGMDPGFGEPRIDPRSLNLDRSLRPRRGEYDLERRGPSGVWRQVQRFGSYEEAATAVDRELAASRAAPASLRISWFDPRRRRKLIGLAVFAVFVLGIVAAWIAFASG